MTENLKPLNELFGMDDNEDTRDKVTEIQISHLKDYHKGNLGENRYSKQDLQDLVESIKVNGIIQPLVVRPLENEDYEIILGHHRRDAALLAGLDRVPCLINDDMDDDVAELVFMDSNLQHGFEKMSQVRSGIISAYVAVAFRIQCAEISLMHGVFDVHISVGGHGYAVSRQTGRQHAVEHIHAALDAFE